MPLRLSKTLQQITGALAPLKFPPPFCLGDISQDSLTARLQQVTTENTEVPLSMEEVPQDSWVVPRPEDPGDGDRTAFLLLFLGWFANSKQYQYRGGRTAESLRSQLANSTAYCVTTAITVSIRFLACKMGTNEHLFHMVI